MLVKIYTDGAARGNPDGPGGYGCVLHYTDRNGNLHEKELSAGYKKTTNNRMELMAAIVGPSLPDPVIFRFQVSGRCLQPALDRWLDQKRMETWKK